jgi:hypothetical protein
MSTITAGRPNRVAVVRLSVDPNSEVKAQEIPNEMNSLPDLDPYLAPALFERAVECLKSTFTAFDVDSHPAAGACECRLRLKPSDALLNFMAALRARNRKRRIRGEHDLILPRKARSKTPARR